MYVDEAVENLVTSIYSSSWVTPPNKDRSPTLETQQLFFKREIIEGKNKISANIAGKTIS